MSLHPIPTSDADEGGFYTVPMLCRRWHCSKLTVRRRAPLLHAFRVGKALLYPFWAVESFERELMRGFAPAVIRESKRFDREFRRAMKEA